jgi:hypothetical protein
MNRRILALVCAGIFAAILPQAKADVWNERTIMHFSGPVEVPGQVLPAGTYVFRLLNSTSNRDIVQIFNKDESHLYGTFLAIPDYRLKPAGKTIVTFEERANGAPEAVKAWFYPGDNYGHEFVYPKSRAMELAKVNNQAVASMPNEMSANTKNQNNTTSANSMNAFRSTPLTAQQPSQQETQITEVFPAPPQGHEHHYENPPAQTPTETASNENQPAPPAASNNSGNTNANNTNANAALPNTASSLPLVGLLGIASLAAAGLLRRSVRG